MDDTQQKIIDAAMILVRDKGYVATTTKDIANLAGVNECTLFRKFENKKAIILSGMKQNKWRANITPEIFENVHWELQPDLEMFMNNYMERVTSDFVKLSIGLRAPQIYEEIAPLILEIPHVFIKSLVTYLEQMEQMGNVRHTDFECAAVTIFSATFGYTFLKASFEQNLSKVKQQEYIKKSVELFVSGISQP